MLGFYFVGRIFLYKPIFLFQDLIKIKFSILRMKNMVLENKNLLQNVVKYVYNKPIEVC